MPWGRFVAYGEGDKLIILSKEEAFGEKFHEEIFKDIGFKHVETLAKLRQCANLPAEKIDLSRESSESMLQWRTIDLFLSDNEKSAAIPIAERRLMALGSSFVEFSPSLHFFSDRLPQLLLLPIISPVINSQQFQVAQQFGREEETIPTMGGDGSDAELPRISMNRRTMT